MRSETQAVAGVGVNPIGMVCCNNAPNRRGRKCPLVRGWVYVVRGITTELCRYNDGEPGVYVEGVFLDCKTTPGIERPFMESRFRPIKTTDISIFTKMLAPAPREREPV